ncbi:hypothetical protein [Ascidiimonas sp. W6]|uniref:hypothetical protein n=1 Tax=Ascidiimonas meishanensis TaxID=3128903 RepID=UPI0030EE63ED
MNRAYSVIYLLLTILIIGCEQTTKRTSILSEESYELEKNAILETLLNETNAAFGRDYQSWRTNWVHRSNVSKTYMNFPDDTYSEMTSWEDIDDFVRTYIKEHPEPAPPPAQPENINIKIYGTGAWVSYEILDEVFGKKRETRLMEKEDGIWKIARMHTTIYGFKKNKK